MKFAFLIMESDFNAKKDNATIHNGAAQIIGVANIKEAAEVAKRLQKEGVGCIELCGAFKEDGVKEIIKATENKLPIGYVIHLPEQDEIYNRAFER